MLQRIEKETLGDTTRQSDRKARGFCRRIPPAPCQRIPTVSRLTPPSRKKLPRPRRFRRAPPSEEAALLALFEEAPDAAQHLSIHRRRDAAGLGILLAWVIDAE